MAKVYVEPRPKSREPHTPITSHVVEDHADSVLYTCQTQNEAIRWAKGRGHHPVMVPRERHLADKKIPGHWREV
jgi:hypothetical protein